MVADPDSHGSALFWKLDPDPHDNEKLDLDPDPRWSRFRSFRGSKIGAVEGRGRSQ